MLDKKLLPLKIALSSQHPELDIVTETFNSFQLSSTLDAVAPLRLKKIKENSPMPWYNEHTQP